MIPLEKVSPLRLNVCQHVLMQPGTTPVTVNLVHSTVLRVRVLSDILKLTYSSSSGGKFVNDSKPIDCGLCC